MEDITRYSICLAQTGRRTVSNRSQIKEYNLERACEMVDYSLMRMGFNDSYAPTKLVIFPEVFMQGWCPNKGDYPTLNEKVAQEIAIRIPGEEIEVLAQKAREYKVFIAGTAHEIIPEISEKFGFNCGFIIDSNGEVCLKYHKNHNYLVHSGRDDVSPQDVYDKYLEVMDGTFGRIKGDKLSCFYPVARTEIGKLGYTICNDGYTFESFRAAGVQGCEVLVRSSGMQEPEGTPPQDMFEVHNRAGASCNLMYVAAVGPGPLAAPRFPANAYPGNSMICDFNGAILVNANYPGETVTFATVDLENLRARRMDAKHHWVAQLRTKAFSEIYNREMYPTNLFTKKGPLDYDQRIEEEYKVIHRLVREGVYIPPKGYVLPDDEE